MSEGKATPVGERASSLTLNENGEVINNAPVKVGIIGCGGHAFRNILPAFQTLNADIRAVCDLVPDKAEAFARKYSNGVFYRDMLAREELDAVFIVLGWTPQGKPLCTSVTLDCLDAGCHVWSEKPIAGRLEELAALIEKRDLTSRFVQVGLDKMHAPAYRKARDLIRNDAFGAPGLLTVRYFLYIPTAEEMELYFSESAEGSRSGRTCLNQLPHPISIVNLLFGELRSMQVVRGSTGLGAITFECANGGIATVLTTPLSVSGQIGRESVWAVSTEGNSVMVENMLDVRFSPAVMRWNIRNDFFHEVSEEEATKLWDPDMVVGRIYNRSMNLQGYYPEVRAFIQSIAEEKAPELGTLEHMQSILKVLAGFRQGPGKAIDLQQM